jgi:hypothetical protein
MTHNRKRAAQAPLFAVSTAKTIFSCKQRPICIKPTVRYLYYNKRIIFVNIVFSKTIRLLLGGYGKISADNRSVPH